MAEEIFSRQTHNRRLRDILWTVQRRLSVQMRWALLGVGMLAIVASSLFASESQFLAQSQSKSQLAQTPSQPQNQNQGYPYPDDFPEDLPDYPIPTGTIGTGTPGNVQGSFAAINAANQQLQNQMNTCVQRKQQALNRLLAQNRQLKQLESLRDRLDTTISKLDSNDRRVPALERQRDQLQNTIDRLNTTIDNSRQTLDDGISRCKDGVSTLQSRIDDLEGSLNDHFNDLMDYELP